MLKFWLNRAYVSASCLLAVAMGSYAAIIPSAPVLDSVTGFPPTFSWNTAAGASSYTLQVSTDYYFSATTFSQSGITGTSLTLPSSLYDSLLESVPWYWRVNAANTNGESGWSSVGSRGGALTCNYVVDLYDQYGGGPANAATNVQLPVTISWGNGLYECTLSPPPFSLQVATDTGFSSLVINTGGLNSSSSYGQTGHLLVYVYSDSAVNLKKGTTYYWRIRNVGGPWLDTSQFTTGGTSVLPVDNKHLKPDFIVSNKMISYSLATPSPVEITFSDVLGRTALVVNRKQSAGRYSIELKNCNLASGHYIVSFKAAGVEKQASVVITR